MDLLFCIGWVFVRVFIILYNIIVGFFFYNVNMDVVLILFSKILVVWGLCIMKENKFIDFLIFYNIFVERK